MAEAGEKSGKDEKLVENPGSKATRALSILRHKRELPEYKSVLRTYGKTGAKMAQPTQSKAENELGTVQIVSGTLSAAHAKNSAQLLLGTCAMR